MCIFNNACIPIHIFAIPAYELLECSSVPFEVPSSSGDNYGEQCWDFRCFSRVSPAYPIPSHHIFINPPSSNHFLFSFISCHTSPHSWLGKMVGLEHQRCIIKPPGGMKRDEHHMLLHWILSLSALRLEQNGSTLADHSSAQGPV